MPSEPAPEFVIDDGDDEGEIELERVPTAELQPAL